jgi:hypothetical protein
MDSPVAILVKEIKCLGNEIKRLRSKRLMKISTLGEYIE